MHVESPVDLTLLAGERTTFSRFRYYRAFVYLESECVSILPFCKSMSLCGGETQGVARTCCRARKVELKKPTTS